MNLANIFTEWSVEQHGDFWTLQRRTYKVWCAFR